MDGDDRKLEVIRKLLAKAEKAGTLDEAEIYNTKAAEMMAAHGIDTAMIAASGERHDEIGSRRIAILDPYSREKATLAGCIASTMNCRTISHPGPKRGQIDSVTIMGFESDLARVELTYTSLLLQATRSVTQQRPPARSSESTAAFRRTWLIGFSAEVHRRLSEAARRAVRQYDAGTSRAALVLADRGSRVEKAYRDMFPDARILPKRRLGGSGYRDGVDAGRRADIGHRRVGRVRRELGPG